MIYKIALFLWGKRRVVVNYIVFACTVILELWLNIVFLPLLVLILSPILIPLIIFTKISTSLAFSFLAYTPIIDWMSQIINFILYKWSWWPRKHIWTCYYSIKSM